MSVQHWETPGAQGLSIFQRLIDWLLEPAETETGWRHLTAIRLLIALDVLLLGVVLYDAPYFHVSRVLVGGTSTADVRRFIPVDDLRGRNVFTIDTAAMAKRIESAVRISTSRSGWTLVARAHSTSCGLYGSMSESTMIRFLTTRPAQVERIAIPIIFP